MATSGSFDFNLTRNEIITASLRKVQGIADGQVPTSEQFSSSSLLLNAMVKNWRGEDIFIWDIDWINIVFQPSSIVLATDGLDYICIRTHTSQASNEPSVGNDSGLFWNKLATASGTPWVTATAYNAIGHIILDSSIMGIENVRIKEGDIYRWIESITEEDYFNKGQVTSTGKPSQYWFRRQRASEVFVFPFPDSATAFTMEMTVFKYLEDFDSSTDTPDLLQEWLKPLIDGLAVELATQYGIFGNQYQILKLEAVESKERAKMIDHETGNSMTQPDLVSELT